MRPVMRDPFGLARVYHDQTGQHVASTIRAVLGKLGGVPRTLDREAVDAFLGGAPRTDRTMLAQVRQLSPGHELVRSHPAATSRPWQPHVERSDLRRRLHDAIDHALSDTPAPHAVALTADVASAIVLSLAREIDPSVGAIVLAPELPGMPDRDEILAVAAALGAEAIVAEVDARQLAAGVPTTISAFEAPIASLVDVLPWWLAGAAHRHGMRTVLTGDGAAQVFTRDASGTYLSRVSAAFASHKLVLRTPFLDADVVAHVLAAPPDPGQRELTNLGAELSIPVPAAPPPPPPASAFSVDELGELAPAERLEAIAAQLGRHLPSPLDASSLVRWSTLALFADAFDVTG